MSSEYPSICIFRAINIAKYRKSLIFLSAQSRVAFSLQENISEPSCRAMQRGGLTATIWIHEIFFPARNIQVKMIDEPQPSDQSLVHPECYGMSGARRNLSLRPSIYCRALPLSPYRAWGSSFDTIHPADKSTGPCYMKDRFCRLALPSAI